MAYSSVARMVEFFKAEGPVEQVGVVHAQSSEEAESVAARLREGMAGQEITMGQIGCVLGTHVGPKAVAIVYIKK